MKRQTLTKLIITFSIIGMAAALYALLAHFSSAFSSLCTIGASFNCDIVNHSSYSEILNIPVALFGLLAYIFILIVTLVYAKTQKESLMTILGATVIAGFAFSLYLTSIEAFVLFTWCIACVTSQICILVLLILILMLRQQDHKKLIKKLADLCKTR